MAKRVTDGFGKVPKIVAEIPAEILLSLEEEEWVVHTTDDNLATLIRMHLEENQLDATLSSFSHGKRKLSGYIVPFELVMHLRSRKHQKNEAKFTAYHRVNREADWIEWQEGKKPVGTLAARGLEEESKAPFREKARAARKASK